MKKLSCIESIDALIDPVEPGWAVEFYGDWDIMYALLHRVIACLSIRGYVYVYLNQLFGGLDPYRLSRISKLLGGDASKIYFSRGLRIEDFESFFEKEPPIEGSLVIVDPYLHTDPKTMGFEIYTKVTSWIRMAASSGNIVIFNRVSRYGGYRPEGGSFHHHSIHIIVRMWRGRAGLYGEVVKHPAKHPSKASLKLEDLVGGGVEWVGQRRLSEWASNPR